MILILFVVALCGSVSYTGEWTVGIAPEETQIVSLGNKISIQCILKRNESEQNSTIKLMQVDLRKDFQTIYSWNASVQSDQFTYSLHVNVKSLIGLYHCIGRFFDSSINRRLILGSKLLNVERDNVTISLVGVQDQIRLAEGKSFKKKCRVSGIDPGETLMLFHNESIVRFTFQPPYNYSEITISREDTKMELGYDVYSINSMHYGVYSCVLMNINTREILNTTSFKLTSPQNKEPWTRSSFPFIPRVSPPKYT